MDSPAAPREPSAPPQGAATFREDTRRAPVVVLALRLPGVVAPVTGLRAVAVSRETRNRYEFPGVLDDPGAAPRRDRGADVLRGRAEVDLRDLAARLDPRDGMLDVFLEVQAGGAGWTSYRVRRPAGARARPWGVVAHADGTVTQFVPYTTFRAANRSLFVERMDAGVHEELRRWRRRAWLLPLVRPFARTWLVGEQPFRAQDNGYHLFRWLREHRPDLRVHYVIDAASPDLPRVQPLGNVVLRHSREHVRVAYLASRLVGTHHAEYLLPTRDPRVVRGMRGVRVFIRHGVSGTKNMVGNYGRLVPGFHTDRIHVSSEHERDTAVEAFRYRPAQVRLTGLPRFDALLRPMEREPDGVLVVPTWREWISNHEAFTGSEYEAAWRSVLTHPRLAGAVAAGLGVTFILHPNMRGFADDFEVPGVRVVRQGEVQLQTLLREHAMLVTDYSSVGFDVALLGRPVAYFHFDRERFFGAQGSHLDLDADLPGTVVRDADALVAEVLAARERGWSVPAEHAARVRRLVRYDDRRNCERVAHSVATAGGPAVQWWRLVDRSRVGARQAARRLRARLRETAP
ncbi:CDP-glycerol glycerophosphotransferase family protein [Phycicoccus flavus]|uniref:CDP-glycerol glycerophosphotransferase family protein n=1 Tax=Phycicoccus flavus TaxID=2502783 RepID=UPI000FEC1922|nr:CDP-glycerol glycerophosphotransferase family protein [Phycicoccus flavus]NHA66773.1 hypothetical protein [Phycicoccus flavus]